ncbi:MAG: STAS domain-containing protein [Solirubrobacterales bacterium]
MAVEVGVVLAGVLALRSVAKSTMFEMDSLETIDIDPATEHELLGEHVVAYRLDGALFFGAAQRFLLELADVSDVEVVILRLGRLKVLDATGAQALGDLVARLQHRGIIVLLACVRPEHRRIVEQIGVIETLANENQVVPNINEALIHARRHMERNRALVPA